MPLLRPSAERIAPSSGSGGETPARSIQLDVLRGIAIFLVIGRHHVVEPRSAGVLFIPAAIWDRYGWTGVDLFFVLSGFLIGGLLIKELLQRGALDLSRFWVRRGLKIWPSYYVFVLWMVAKQVWSVGFKSASLPAMWQQFWPCLLNVQNYFYLPRLHLWSLAVEEHFYLLLPLLLWFFAGTPELLRRTRLAIAAAVLMLACLALRTWTVFTSPPSLYNHYFTHLRIDGLLFGFLLAYIHYVHPVWWGVLGRRRSLLLFLGLTAIAPAGILLYDNPWAVSLGLTVLYLGYGAILIAFVSKSAGAHWLDRLLRSRPARWLAFVGLYSYPIYLWHVDVGGLVATLSANQLTLHPELHWFLDTGAFIAVSIGVGMLMAVVIERPILRLRNRYYPARSALSNV